VAVLLVQLEDLRRAHVADAVALADVQIDVRSHH
jgi:hypothetical protein